MTRDQLIERYDELYDVMKSSRDVEKMKVFGEAEKGMFRMMASSNPSMAETWIMQLEAVCWDNYLSEKEARNIGRRIVNQDGTKEFHWPYDVFTKAVAQLGGVVEEKPYYNSYALWVTANMIYSDHARSVAEDMGYKSPHEVPNERMALSMYKKAVESLKDPDKGYHIRKYFKGKMHDE